jgi:non-heme chloroperoxidase
MPTFNAPDGTALFFKDWGKGQPVVFVHTNVLNSDAWDYQMTLLAGRGFRAIAYDRRGHGRSDRPCHGYDFNTLADDLASLLNHLDLTGVTLVGHSMGCGEIARYLSRHGSARVKKTVFVAPITPFIMRTSDNPGGLDPAILDGTIAAIQADYPRLLRELAPGFWGRDDRISQEMKDWGQQMALQTSLQAVTQLTAAVWHTDFRTDLPAIDVPTLILQGEKDESTPVACCGEPTAAAIAGSRLVVYEGVAHALPLIARERFDRDLLEFVSA